MKDKDKKRRKSTRKIGKVVQSHKEETETNPRLKALLLEVVENQLREGDPPETRQTYERLIAAGYTHDRVMEMIASALVGEIWTILKEQKDFDRARYAALLGELR